LANFLHRITSLAHNRTLARIPADSGNVDFRALPQETAERDQDRQIKIQIASTSLAKIAAARVEYRAKSSDSPRSPAKPVEDKHDPFADALRLRDLSRILPALSG
jgi:hypothetical protein